MSVNLIEPTWNLSQAASVLIGALYRAMARVERECMGFLGLTTVPDLPPPKLSDPFPCAVRWIDQLAIQDKGWDQLAGHAGIVSYENLTVAVFVACAPLAASIDPGRLQDQFQWVPLAYHATYAKNHTLDGAVRTATLNRSLVRWATAQRYAGDYFAGWLIPVLVKLRYTVGAS